MTGYLLSIANCKMSLTSVERDTLFALAQSVINFISFAGNRSVSISSDVLIFRLISGLVLNFYLFCRWPNQNIF